MYIVYTVLKKKIDHDKNSTLLDNSRCNKLKTLNFLLMLHDLTMTLTAYSLQNLCRTLVMVEAL